jgi:hypothetical protein
VIVTWENGVTRRQPHSTTTMSTTNTTQAGLKLRPGLFVLMAVSKRLKHSMAKYGTIPQTHDSELNGCKR